MQSYLVKAKAILPVVSRFAAGQIGLQFFSILNGFFLLRWLSIEQQAMFSIAFSAQTLLTALSDLGLSNGIIALVGIHYNNKGVVGKYMVGARYLRNVFFFVSIVVCTVLYPLLMKQQAWHSQTFWLNMLPVILAAYWQADVGIYAAPLMIHKKMSSYYTPQIVSSALRLIANFTLYIGGWINAFTTLMINAGVMFFNGRSFKISARKLYTSAQTDATTQEQTRKEILKYLSPLIPGLLFNSIYGQLQVFIIAFFGKTANIAEVAALGRLSQIFGLLSAFNGVLIGPYLAKSDTSILHKRYFTSLMLAVTIAVMIVLSSIVIPGFYMFILGGKFHHLKNELLLIISTASIGFISTVFWVMHSARQWLFWWSTWAYIIGVMVCQIVGILTIDLSTTHGVLLLSFFTTVVVFLIYAFTGWYGFRKQQMTFNWRFARANK